MKNENVDAKIIKGKEFAEKLREKIGKEVSNLKSKFNLTPGLAVILVGEDPVSQVYVRNKVKQTIDCGMSSFEYPLAENVTEEELLNKIKELNQNDNIHGILVQLPLPKHIDEKKIINTINPDKDVDGFHISNVGKLSIGESCLTPCTPTGCVMLLKNTLGDLTGLNAIVIGRSNIVGKPIAQMLLNENCTVTIAHSRTKDLEADCRRADIVVSAVGVREMVRGEWIKPGATVIDVGINRITDNNGKYKLVGDVYFDEVKKVAGAITPVPGGVGPMTIACLLQNTLISACRLNNINIEDVKE